MERSYKILEDGSLEGSCTYSAKDIVVKVSGVDTTVGKTAPFTSVDVVQPQSLPSLREFLQSELDKWNGQLTVAKQNANDYADVSQQLMDNILLLQPLVTTIVESGKVNARQKKDLEPLVILVQRMNMLLSSKRHIEAVQPQVDAIQEQLSWVDRALQR